ncbi:MAG TPA: fibronectin type III domain-containing protein [Candidatus Dojkabacteria bacterium]|nr:fibronectin type III domain-containing protein [Candidatus Dojkabacteria bacterium]
MSITTIKVLRTISKIVLLIIGIGIIGYGGLMVYKSVVNKPQRVRITNVTDSATTITWVTDNPVRGVVYYKDEGSFLPGPLGFLGSKVAYDDRDFARAQDECVKAFNENAKNTKDEDFAVDGNNFDCENIPVEKLGAYYTHSVTIKNLNESSTYFFVVGNGIWSWNVDGVDKEISENDLPIANSFNFKTSRLLEEVPTPNIAYGTVYAGVKSEEGYLSESLSKDSLVYAYLVVDGKNSQVISSVTNTAGGWIFDKSNFRDTEGNLITDLSKAKMMVRAQYEDVLEARWVDVVDSLDVDTELDLSGNLVDDLTEGEKKVILDRFESLIDKVYAAPSQQSYHQCPDGDSYDVSGCSTDSRCLKKCLNTNVNENEWVDFGR